MVAETDPLKPTKLQRVVHAVASGYVSLIATALFSFVAVPLALDYLDKERFGLWALMGAIAGYLALIDLGMSASVARLLIDFKDRRDDGPYGSLIQTGSLVLSIQAIIVWVAGFAIAPVLSDLLLIPPDLETEFIGLLRWQCFTLAITFATRIFSHILQAHQRFDVVNYSQIVGATLNLGLQWLFFWMGEGVFSLAWAGLASTGLSVLLCGIACSKMHFFPMGAGWGKPSRDLFNQLFSYGKDLFLVSVGAQLILASQALIVTRTMGLSVTAVWNVGSRTFNLVCQGICRIADFSGPAFAEMIVRGENVRLRERYQAMVTLTASLSGVAAVIFVLCNTQFITVLTHEFYWYPLHSVLLGVWLIALSVQRCHGLFVMTTKDVGGLRYIYFVEGCVFVLLALFASGRGGLTVMITYSIICTLCFSLIYGVHRISRYFGCSAREVGFGWLAPLGKVMLLFVPPAAVFWWFTNHLDSVLLQLVLNGLFGGSLGAFLFLRFGLPARLQAEFLHRSPKTISPILKRVFA